MNHLVFFVYLALTVFLIQKFRLLQLRGISVLYSQLFFACKCVLVYFLFGYYKDVPQPVDAGSYLHDAGLLFNMLLEEPVDAARYIFGTGGLPEGYANTEFYVWNAPVFLPFFNDNRTIILVNVLLRFISFGSPGAHLVWMAFVGWIGICQLGKTFLPESKSGIDHLFPFIVPQVLIWTTVVLKEPLMIFSLGFLVHGLSEWSKHSSKAWTKTLIGLAGFLLVKTFLLVLLIPATTSFILAHLFRKIKPLWTFLFIHGVLLGTLIFLSQFAEEFNIPALLYGQQLSMYRFVVYSHAGSILQPILLAPEWTSFLKRIPESIGYALMQPFPWLYSIKFGWVVFIENCLVVTFFIYGLVKNRHVIVYSPKRLMMITGGLIILVVAGFVAPVAGALIRYKMPGILLLLLGVLPARHHLHHRHSKADTRTGTPNEEKMV